MADFFSRLVGRTHGLLPVAQPVSRLIFAPEPSLVSERTENLTCRSESASPNNSYTDSFQKPRTTSQDNSQGLSSQKVPFNKNDDKFLQQIEDRNRQSSFISSSESQHNIEPLKLKNSDFSEEPEVLPLNKRNEEENLHLNSPPFELTQNKASFYKTDSETFESTELEPSHPKNRKSQNPTQFIAKSKLKEQVDFREQGAEGKLEPLIKIVDSSKKALPGNRANSEYVSDSSLKSGSLAIKNNELPQQSNEAMSRADINSVTFSNPDSILAPTVSSRRSLNQKGTLRGNDIPKQMGSMEIEKNAVSPGFSSNPPTVKVTIGRIEVRAVSPPVETQPQKPPKQYPVLSLDDYLKQNNGG